MAKNKELGLKEMEEIIDMTTGLTLLQKKAAELSAMGKSDPQIGKAIGKHFNTIKNWRKKLPAFRLIEETYVIKEDKPLIVPPMTTKAIDNPEAITLRMAALVPRSIETIDNILMQTETPPSVKLAAAKFICTTVYDRLKPMEGQTNEHLEELKEAIARANSQDLSIANSDR